MRHVNTNVNTALFLGIVSLTDLFVSILLSVTLFVNENLMKEVTKVVEYYLLYAFTFYNMILALVALFMVGNFTNILLRVTRDRKGFHNRLIIMSYFILFDILIGSVYCALFINRYLETSNAYLFDATWAISIVTGFGVLLYICMYFLHPDLWHFKRRREINEMLVS